MVMEQFDLHDKNAVEAVYKPLMPGASPPPFPSSPPHDLPPAANPPEIPISGPVEQTKRKRGRPRKYAPPDGKAAVAGVLSSELASGGKRRGRPAGSSRKCQQHGLGVSDSSSNCSEFTPHIIIVNTGEDISSKIMSFAQSCSKAVCIISAHGEISSVTISRALTCGGTIAYEGRFQIIKLSGLYMFSESVGQYSTKGLSIILSGSGGHVLGGCVAGALIAASSVQIIVGSFIPRELRHVKQTEVDPSKILTRTWSVGSPLSRGTMSECSGGTGSPINLSSGVCNNNSMQQEMVPFLGNI